MSSVHGRVCPVEGGAHGETGTIHIPEVGEVAGVLTCLPTRAGPGTTAGTVAT